MTSREFVQTLTLHVVSILVWGGVMDLTGYWYAAGLLLIFVLTAGFAMAKYRRVL